MKTDKVAYETCNDIYVIVDFYSSQRETSDSTVNVQLTALNV